MPNIRKISINGSAGAFVDVLVTVPARYVDVREDEVATSQGLDFKIIHDNFVTTYDVGPVGTPDVPQIRIPATGNILSHGMGTPIGYPAQAGLLNTTATKILSIRSKTVTATNIRVQEQE